MPKRTKNTIFTLTSRNSAKLFCKLRTLGSSRSHFCSSLLLQTFPPFSFIKLFSDPSLRQSYSSSLSALRLEFLRFYTLLTSPINPSFLGGSSVGYSLMETASSVASTRGGSLQNPSPTPTRKEWRAVSDSHNILDLEQLKLNQTAERTIYENGREGADLDYYSITMDGCCSDAEQRLHTITKQKGELNQMEIDLRAQMIAIEVQRNFESQSTEYANAAARMQEQLHEKEIALREMERKIEEKDRELHAIKLDNEAAWAKEGLLREQNKELATLRRERDHSEAERSQSIQKISELQEHIQEKESQLTELQEQNRIAQETILYKDEQLREAQGWMARAQEMDVLQSSTNHSLQAELRERTEQYNQLWLGCQRQFAEMERGYLHTVQQLQLELANVREGGGSKTNASQTIQSSGNQFETRGNSVESANVNVHPNGKSSDNISSFTPSDDRANQNNRVDGVSVASSSHLGYLQAGQMTPLHSFVMQQREIPQPRGPSPHVAQSVLLQQKAVATDISQMPMQNHGHPSQVAHGLISSDAKSGYQVSANGQGYVDVQTSQGAQYGGSSTPSSSVSEQAVESGNGNYIGSTRSENNNFQDISSQFRDALRLDPLILNQKPEEASEQNGSGSVETLVTSGKADERNLESALLDERALLACIVRTIPAGGRIRMSSTLPNRLGKMLAPLHWHDYKKKYGKLDDFVASHVELFVIEDDYIQVREGAQKMVAASAAAAKVAAAAAASSSPNSVYVAMTPMAQSQGFKKNDNNKTLLHRDNISNVKILTKPQRKL